MNICSKCHKEKPLSDFYFRKDSNTYRTECRECYRSSRDFWRRNNLAKVNESGKKWRLANLEKDRESKMNSTYKRRYGITLQEKRQMWYDQDGRCLICGKEMRTRGDCNLDHDHKTGRNRGLLCLKCNVGLHYIENIPFMKNATNYLSRYK